MIRILTGDYLKALILSILQELSPCSSYEIYDYMKSDFFYKKGNLYLDHISIARISRFLVQIEKENKSIFKFICADGFNFRYGYTKFKFYLPLEPRYLKPQGYLKRCMNCGMPIYIEGDRVFHFKYHCSQFQQQDYFKLIKFGKKRAIISHNFVYGVIDDLNTSNLRFPFKNMDNQENILSELWIINETARKLGLIELDKILPLKADEYIS